MSIDVGSRLKQIRNEHGLSQRKLASLAGVTNGLISLIEQNRTSPSIASLKLILDAFPITFTAFFDVSEDNPDKFVFRSDELPEINPLRVTTGNQTGDIAGISLRQVGGVHKHQIQMLHETYEPGSDTGQELYKHEAEEAGLVISGEIELTVGKETATLKAGDGYIFDSRKPHRFRNTGKKRCVIVSACTPPSF
ncbi:MAG: cupin domain-containing protein [Granulosicoccus sp.]